MPPNIDPSTELGKALDAVVDALATGGADAGVSAVLRASPPDGDLTQSLVTFLLALKDRTPAHSKLLDRESERVDRRGPAASADLPQFSPDFEVLREIGRGGMAVVFEALEPALNRRLAVKTPTSSEFRDSGTGMLGRFEREPRVTAKLRHTNIVPIFAVGRSEQRPYYTMPYIDGPSLARRLVRRERLSSRQRVRLLSPFTSVFGSRRRWPMPMATASSTAKSSRATS